MNYVDCIELGASKASRKEHLSEGEQATIMICILNNLRESSREASAMRSTSFRALFCQGLFQQLSVVR